MTPLITRLALKIHYWNRKRMFDRKYREAVPYVTRDSSFEQEKYRRQLEILGDRRYRRAMEVGCGEGVFLNQLASRCGEVVGIDISEEAIRRARIHCAEFPHVQFTVENLATAKYDPKFDLVVATDVLYYMGQEHDWAHMQNVIGNVCRAVAPGGRFLLTNCHTGMSHDKDWLSLQVMRRYREECERAGLSLVSERGFESHNGDRHVPYLISLLEKPALPA